MKNDVQLRLENDSFNCHRPTVESAMERGETPLYWYPRVNACVCQPKLEKITLKETRSGFSAICTPTSHHVLDDLP